MSLQLITVVVFSVTALTQLFLAVVILRWVMSLRKGTASENNMITAFNNMEHAFGHMLEAFTTQQETFKDVVDWTVPPEEWDNVISLRNMLIANGSQHGDYLIYCRRNGGYWSIDERGYTPERKLAKRFGAAEALMVVLDRARNSDPDDCYTLLRTAKGEEDPYNGHCRNCYAFKGQYGGECVNPDCPCHAEEKLEGLAL